MLFAFVGCAGVGKNTIIRDLLDAHRDEYDLLPTLTTRAMRPGESEGNPYCFVSEEEFKRQLDEGLIYEHQFIHKSYYGGSRLILEKKLQEGKALLKDIDILGANNLKTILKDTLLHLPVCGFVRRAAQPPARPRRRGNRHSAAREAL